MDDDREWMFPICVNKATGRMEEISGDEMIKQSIRLVLSTKVGERYFEPAFGCDLYKFMFEHADYTTLKQIENEIKKSLAKWEKRIRDIEVIALADQGDPDKVIVTIRYKTAFSHAKFEYIHNLVMR